MCVRVSVCLVVGLIMCVLVSLCASMFVVSWFVSFFIYLRVANFV